MKKIVEPLLSPNIVPGVLQHDSSRLLSSINTPSHSGLTRQLSKDAVVQRALDDLIALLNIFYNKLQAFGADTILIKQIFWQITKWICAQALDNLMFRKDLCTLEKAIQIKHNVSELQNWLYQKELGDIRPVLEPLVQACHLLQSQKDEENLEKLCGEMTSELNGKQVTSILQHYTPSDEFEEDPIDKEFINKVQRRFAAKAAASGDDNQDKEKFIISGTFLQPFNCEPFVYSDINLKTITLPPFLHLNNVARFA
uniref:Dilute domain-containing protein n=1 Tax=Panagrolaimus sp. ES5 TaxID=591445 RepID=A0AC34G4S0_9BILA